MLLPLPDDELSLVLRAHFGDDRAWAQVQAALDTADEFVYATCVNDPRFAGVSIQELIDEEAAAEEGSRIGYVFLADAVTMADPEHPLLTVALADQPGRTFRLPSQFIPQISANLGISNMDFADYASTAEEAGGTFRGFTC